MDLNLIPFDQVTRMAQAVAASNLFGMKSPEQALTLMLLAQAEGLHPMTAARDYHIIQGKPSKKPEAMQRDFLVSGGKIEWIELTDKQVTAIFSHPQGGTVEISWNMARAQQAGLGGKENWSKWPRQMLRSRVISEGCKTVWPAATGGLYTPEEVIDFSDPKNVTPMKQIEVPKSAPKAKKKESPPSPIESKIEDDMNKRAKVDFFEVVTKLIDDGVFPDTDTAVKRLLDSDKAKVEHVEGFKTKEIRLKVIAATQAGMDMLKAGA